MILFMNGAKWNERSRIIATTKIKEATRQVFRTVQVFDHRRRPKKKNKNKIKRQLELSASKE